MSGTKKLGAQARAFFMLGIIFIVLGFVVKINGIWILGLIFIIMTIVSRFVIRR